MWPFKFIPLLPLLKRPRMTFSSSSTISSTRTIPSLITFITYSIKVLSSTRTKMIFLKSSIPILSFIEKTRKTSLYRLRSIRRMFIQKPSSQGLRLFTAPFLRSIPLPSSCYLYDRQIFFLNSSIN